MSLWKRMLAVAAAALGLNAQAGQYTDLWWDPQESGWGMNIVQQADIAFVTLFVYGADGKPLWYSGSETRVVAYGTGGLPLFSGPLHRTTGPWQGGPFDPNQVTRVQVGTISLETLAHDRMRVQYTADGATVSKIVRRSTWSLPLAAVNYHASFSLRQAFSNGIPYGVMQFNGNMLLQEDGAGTSVLRIEDNLERVCEYRGAHEQTGKLARMTGTFACTGFTAFAGTFELTDLEFTEHGVTGFLRTTSPNRVEFGRFAGGRY